MSLDELQAQLRGALDQQFAALKVITKAPSRKRGSSRGPTPSRSCSRSCISNVIDEVTKHRLWSVKQSRRRSTGLTPRLARYGTRGEGRPELALQRRGNRRGFGDCPTPERKRGRLECPVQGSCADGRDCNVRPTLEERVGSDPPLTESSVQALAAHRASQSFTEGVRLRCSQRRLQDRQSHGRYRAFELLGSFAIASGN